MRIVLAALLTMIATLSPALAYQTFLEYRIRGDEIVSVKMGPQEVEDPALIILTIAPDGGTPVTIEIESDLGLDECFAELQGAVGNDLAYAQIVVHTNAYTMNGMAVTTCAVMQGLH